MCVQSALLRQFFVSWILWNNRFIKIEKFSVYYQSWHRAGIIRVNQIFCESNFLTFNDFCQDGENYYFEAFLAYLKSKLFIEKSEFKSQIILQTHLPQRQTQQSKTQSHDTYTCVCFFFLFVFVSLSYVFLSFFCFSFPLLFF